MKGNGWRLTLAVVTAIAVVIAVRVMCVALISIPTDGHAPTLLAGDRLIMGRWAYGLRKPWSRSGDRWGSQWAQVGQWLVYNSPSTQTILQPASGAVCVGLCIAAPGDTLWVCQKGHVSRLHTRGSQQRAMVLPSRGEYVDIEPWSAPVYARIITSYERLEAKAENGHLVIGGRHIGRFRFGHDYYWTYSGTSTDLRDSRTMGFVPHEMLMGRIRCVLYSIDAQSNWLHAWRWERCLKAVE